MLLFCGRSHRAFHVAVRINTCDIGAGTWTSACRRSRRGKLWIEPSSWSRTSWSASQVKQRLSSRAFTCETYERLRVWCHLCLSSSHRARRQLRGSLPPRQSGHRGAERTLHLGPRTRQALIGRLSSRELLLTSRPGSSLPPAGFCFLLWEGDGRTHWWIRMFLIWDEDRLTLIGLLSVHDESEPVDLVLKYLYHAIYLFIYLFIGLCDVKMVCVCVCECARVGV